jgi:hypothetical protein
MKKIISSFIPTLIFILAIHSVYGQSFTLSKKPNNPTPTDYEISGRCLINQIGNEVEFGEPHGIRLEVYFDDGLVNPQITIVITDIEGNHLPTSLIYPYQFNPQYSNYNLVNTFTVPESGSLLQIDFNIRSLSEQDLKDIVVHVDIEQIPSPPKTWDHREVFQVCSYEKHEQTPPIEGRSIYQERDSQIIIFPNPSIDFFIIHSTKDILNYNLDLFSLDGRTLRNTINYRSKKELVVHFMENIIGPIVISGHVNSKEFHTIIYSY